MHDLQPRLDRALDRTLKALVFRAHPGLPPADLPVSQLRCLHIVSEGEGMRVADLAHSLAVKLPAASQIVDRLVKRGLLVRQPDTQDRRVVRLYLTDEARAMGARMRGLREARLSATLRHLSEEQIGKAIAGIELLAQAAETQAAQEAAASPPPDPQAFPEVLTQRGVPLVP